MTMFNHASDAHFEKGHFPDQREEGSSWHHTKMYKINWSLNFDVPNVSTKTKEQEVH